MKKAKALLFSLAVLTGVAAVHGQTADDIIAKHLDAIGGKEKLKGITTVKMNNAMQVMGNELQNTTTIINGKAFRSESEFGGQKIIQVFTDKGSWAVNPMAGATDPQALTEDQSKAGQAQMYPVPFLDYASRGDKAELLGQEKVGDVNAYKIKLTDKNNMATTYYIDPSTYYVIKQVSTAEMMGQQMDVTTTFSDFKKTDYGWVVPQGLEINMGGQFSMTGKLSSIEVNKEVDPKIFDMPGK
jgi:outer membrane lipoprotein-sorting protein